MSPRASPTRKAPERFGFEEGSAGADKALDPKVQRMGEDQDVTEARKKKGGNTPNKKVADTKAAGKKTVGGKAENKTSPAKGSEGQGAAAEEKRLRLKLNFGEKPGPKTTDPTISAAPKTPAPRKTPAPPNTPAAPKNKKRPAADSATPAGPKKRARITKTSTKISTKTSAKPTSSKDGLGGTAKPRRRKASPVGRGKKKASRATAVRRATKHGPRQLTWFVNHVDRGLGDIQTNIDVVGFHSHGQYYGGPFNFLSNFYPCRIYDRDLHLQHLFNSVEQYYQFVRTIGMAEASPAYDNNWVTPVSSKEAATYILLSSKPGSIANLGRSFNFLIKARPEWAMQWLPGWEQCVEFVVKRAVYLKFTQNPDLMDLLLRTGSHRLVEASATDDACGIGFSAQTAMGNIGRWGRNMLGEALMDVRDFARKKNGVTGEYDSKYFEGEIAKREAYAA